MVTLKFANYAGTYTVAEAKELTKKLTKEILDAEKKADIDRIKSKYGDKYTYEVKKGVRIDLTKLKAGEKVCASFIKGHHIFMIEKPNYK